MNIKAKYKFNNGMLTTITLTGFDAEDHGATYDYHFAGRDDTQGAALRCRSYNERAKYKKCLHQFSHDYIEPKCKLLGFKTKFDLSDGSLIIKLSKKSRFNPFMVIVAKKWVAKWYNLYQILIHILHAFGLDKNNPISITSNDVAGFILNDLMVKVADPKNIKLAERLLTQVPTWLMKGNDDDMARCYSLPYIVSSSHIFISAKNVIALIKNMSGEASHA